MSDLFGFENTEVVSLDELVQENEIELGRGNVISKIDIRETPGNYPIYSSSAQRNGKMGEYGNYMFDEELITWSVDGGGRFFYREEHKYSVTNVCGYMRINNGKSFDYRFLHAILDYQHQRLRFDYQTKAHPSVIRQLYEIPRLRLGEQKKIADILSSVDEVIENTESEINKLEDLKKATLNELLTKGIGHTEFKESEIGRIPKSWSVQPLGQHIDRQRSGASLSPSEFSHQGFRVIPKKAIQFGGSVVINAEPTFCTPSSVDSHKSSVVDQSYVVSVLRDLVPTGPSIGLIGVIEEKGEMMLAQGLYGFLLRNTLEPLFISFLSNSAWYRREMRKLFVGSTQIHIRSSEFVDVRIPVPSIEEQREIIHHVKVIRNQIAEKRRLAEKYRGIKHGLMRDLLGGTVRVAV